MSRSEPLTIAWVRSVIQSDIDERLSVVLREPELAKASCRRLLERCRGWPQSSLWIGQIPLLVLHAFTCCISLSYIGVVYQHEIIFAFSRSRLLEAIFTAGIFAAAGIALLVRIRSDFSYWIGFYFFTLVLGYLWIAPFSRLSYNYEAAATSSFAGGLAFLAAQLLHHPIERKFTLSELAMKRLCLTILIAAAAAVCVGASYNFRLASLSEVDEFRDEAVFPLMLRYAISAVSAALLPLAFAYFVELRRLRLAGLSLVILLAFYPVTTAKIMALGPFWLLFLAVLVSLFGARAAIIFSLLLPASAGLFSILVSGKNAFFGMINFRMIAIPSIALDVYNDFFAHHPLTHFCQINLIRVFVSCPYSEPLGTVMQNAFHFGNFNASMFATEGIASFGLTVAPLIAFACGLVIALAGSISATLPSRFVLLSTGILIQEFLNVPFSTVMLSYGGFMLFALWYAMPRSPPITQAQKLLPRRQGEPPA